MCVRVCGRGVHEKDALNPAHVWRSNVRNETGYVVLGHLLEALVLPVRME